MLLLSARSVAVFAAVAFACLGGAPRAGGAGEPGNPQPLPAEAPANLKKNFLVAAGSTSPDGRFAVIFPTLESSEAKDAKDYVVALRPFRIVTELKTRWPYFQNQSNSGTTTEWLRDGTAALVTIESKWGPGDIFLLEFREGQLARETDLGARIRQVLLPDFKAAKAERYNDENEFVLEPDGSSASVKFGPGGAVRIRCLGSTDPKGMGGSRSWKGRLVAEWSVAQGRFARQKVTRLAVGKSREG